MKPKFQSAGNVTTLVARWVDLGGGRSACEDPGLTRGDVYTERDCGEREHSGGDGKNEREDDKMDFHLSLPRFID